MKVYCKKLKILYNETQHRRMFTDANPVLFQDDINEAYNSFQSKTIERFNILDQWLHVLSRYSTLKDLDQKVIKYSISAKNSYSIAESMLINNNDFFNTEFTTQMKQIKDQFAKINVRNCLTFSKRSLINTISDYKIPLDLDPLRDIE